MATIVDIAEAVKTTLAAASLSRPFTAQRTLMPVKELAQLTTLQVIVVPRGVEIVLHTRSSCLQQVKIDVGICQKIDIQIPAQLDELVAFVDEVEKFLRQKPQANAQWKKSEYQTLYDPASLNQDHSFVSVITVTYEQCST